MTPQERQLIDDLFDRLAKLEDAPRDPEAMSAIMHGLRKAPNGVYALVQTALVQDEALKRANDRIQQMEAALGGEQNSNPAVSWIRCAMRSSVRTSRSSAARCRRSARPTWAAIRAGVRSGTPDRRCSSRRRRDPAMPSPAMASPNTASPIRSALWRAVRRRRRRRLVPRDRGGGCGRRGRWLAAARQHPRHDGRRRPPAGVWRYRLVRRRRRPSRGATGRAAIWRGTPGSTTSARRADGSHTTATARARDCSISASNDDDGRSRRFDGFDDDGGGDDGGSDYA